MDSTSMKLYSLIQRDVNEPVSNSNLVIDLTVDWKGT
jgi:hypothetical protein